VSLLRTIPISRISRAAYPMTMRFAISSSNGPLIIFLVSNECHFAYGLPNSCSEKPSPTTHTDDSLPAITISLNEDKFPRLISPEDLEDVSLKMIKKALTDYMIAAWGMYFVSICNA
jgi:hypothetical protein